MSGDAPRPDERAPRHRGRRLGWLVGTLPGLVALAFVVLVVVVVLVALLG